MTYRPATGDALAASLGVPASDAPTVTCDGCDLVLRAVTTRGGMPAWLRANRAPPGWSMEPLGAALAVAQPGDVLEYRHLDRWWQILVDSKSVVSRLRKISTASWGEWKTVQLDLRLGRSILPLPCRLVPFDAADADPATRGLLPTGALEPSR